MTIYRRWPHKAAIVMDAFFDRVGPKHTISASRDLHRKHQAADARRSKVFRGKDGTLVRTIFAEAQFDPELASAFREKWVIPRRKMALAYLKKVLRMASFARTSI